MTISRTVCVYDSKRYQFPRPSYVLTHSSLRSLYEFALCSFARPAKFFSMPCYWQTIVMASILGYLYLLPHRICNASLDDSVHQFCGNCTLDLHAHVVHIKRPEIVGSQALIPFGAMLWRTQPPKLVI